MKKRDLKYDYKKTKEPMPKKFKNLRFRCQNNECNGIYTIKEPKIISCPFCGNKKDFKELFRNPDSRMERLPIPKSEIFINVCDSPKIPEKELEQLIKEIIPQNRSLEYYEKRVRVVRFLREVRKYSWIKIGKIIHRDHGSAINLYRPKKLKNKR